MHSTREIGFVGPSRLPVTVDWEVSYRDGAPHMHGQMLLGRHELSRLTADGANRVSLHLVGATADQSVRIVEMRPGGNGVIEIAFVADAGPLAA